MQTNAPGDVGRARVAIKKALALVSDEFGRDIAALAFMELAKELAVIYLGEERGKGDYAETTRPLIGQ